MTNRIVIFGCSHACGAEIEGPHILWSNANIERSFGNLVASHYGKQVKISARPGGSNKQMLINAIEHVEPGDVCLLSWTYFDRNNYFARSNIDEIYSDIYNQYHTLKVLALQDKTSKFTEIFKQLFNNNDHYNPSHQFTEKYTNDTVISISNANQKYYADRVYVALDFLQTFHSVNAIIKSKAAIPVNFHYDCDEDVLHLINKFIKWPTDKLFKDDFYNDFDTPEYTLQVPYSNNLKLFNNYVNNKAIIRFERVELSDASNPVIPTSFKKWVCQNLYESPQIWPGGRLGHLGEKEHYILADLIIKHLEENLNDNN